MGVSNYSADILHFSVSGMDMNMSSWYMLHKTLLCGSHFFSVCIQSNYSLTITQIQYDICHNTMIVGTAFVMYQMIHLLFVTFVCVVSCLKKQSRGAAEILISSPAKQIYSSSILSYQKQKMFFFCSNFYCISATYS
jgi:hypothetical protein